MRTILRDSPLREFPFRLLPHFQHSPDELERTLAWEEEFRSSLRLKPISVRITGDDSAARDLSQASIDFQSTPAGSDDSDYLLVLQAGTVLHPSALFILSKKLAETGARLIYWDETIYQPPKYLDGGGLRLTGYERKGRPSNLSFAGRNVPGTSALLHRSLSNLLPSLWNVSLQSGDRETLHIPLSLSSRVEWRESPRPALTQEKEPDYRLLQRYGIETRSVTLSAGRFGTRTRIDLEPSDGEIGVVIPFRDQSELTSKALHSLAKQTVASRLHVRLVDNGSAQTEKEQIEEMLGKLPFSSASIISDTGYFNFARLNNAGLRSLPAERISAVVLMNNDVELSQADLIEVLFSWSRVPEVGLVGGTLVYPGGRVQSAGINFSQVRPTNIHTPEMLSDALREVDGLTFALALIRTEVFEALGGLDEAHCPNGFGDALFCHEAAKRGFRSLHVPWLTAVHHESVSRGARPEELELLEMAEHGLPIADLWSDLEAQRQPMYIPLTHSSSAFHSVVRHVSASPKLLRTAEAVCRPVIQAGRMIRKVVP